MVDEHMFYVFVSKAQNEQEILLFLSLEIGVEAIVIKITLSFRHPCGLLVLNNCSHQPASKL